jgi:hypothetical protein
MGGVSRKRQELRGFVLEGDTWRAGLTATVPEALAEHVEYLVGSPPSAVEVLAAWEGVGVARGRGVGGEWRLRRTSVQEATTSPWRDEP